jgi:hypothetical protein
VTEKAPYPSLGRLIREASACIGWSYNREADRRPRLDALDGIAHEAVREVLRDAAERQRAAGFPEAADLIDPDKPETT